MLYFRFRCFTCFDCIAGSLFRLLLLWLLHMGSIALATWFALITSHVLVVSLVLFASTLLVWLLSLLFHLIWLLWMLGLRSWLNFVAALIHDDSITCFICFGSFTCLRLWLVCLTLLLHLVCDLVRFGFWRQKESANGFRFCNRRNMGDAADELPEGLSYQKLENILDHRTLSELIRVQHLRLARKYLTALPVTLASAQAVQFIDLSRNNLKRFAGKWAYDAFPHLRILRLEHNQLNQLEDILGRHQMQRSLTTILMEVCVP